MNTLTNERLEEIIERRSPSLRWEESPAMATELLSLRAQLAELRGQAPYGWDCEGALIKTVSCRDSYVRNGVAAVPLFSNPVPPAASQPERIGFRCRRNDGLGDWSYVYHRSPDEFELKHLAIEYVCVEREPASQPNQHRTEGIIFTANLLLAAWDAGFIDKPASDTLDVATVILSAIDALPNATDGDFKRDFTDEMLTFLREEAKKKPETPAASQPVAWQWFYLKQWHVTNDPERARDVAEGGVEVQPLGVCSASQPSYRDGIEAAAKWIDKQREAFDNEHGQHDPDTGTFEFGNDTQLEHSSILAELSEGIRALQPAASQPVGHDSIKGIELAVESLKDTIKRAKRFRYCLGSLMNLDDEVASLKKRMATTESQPYTVPDEAKSRELFEAWFSIDCSFDCSPEATDADNYAWKESLWHTWEHCRAAMLQSGNSPVVPIRYMNRYAGACFTLEQQPDTATDTDVYIPLVPMHKGE